jgi:tetratricopeptide (TPR) repeat protein
MSTLCEKLYLFIDGELTQEECEHLRGHLAGCEACARGFQEALQLEMLAAEAFGDSRALGLAPKLSPSGLEEQPPPAASGRLPIAAARRDDSPRTARPRVRRHRRAVWGMAVAVAMAAVVYVSVPQGGASPQLWLAEAPTRQLEGRLSFNLLDAHRPFVPMRSGDAAAVEPVPLSELARLDEKKDAVAIAAAFLVRGDAEQARGFLEAAPPSPERDNALAVVAMQRGELTEALRLLEQVLQQSPGQPQAQWNRALVLRDLGQKEQAAQAFEQLAARGEPGWSEEAAHNARCLRRSLAP